MEAFSKRRSDFYSPRGLQTKVLGFPQSFITIPGKKKPDYPFCCNPINLGNFHKMEVPPGKNLLTAIYYNSTDIITKRSPRRKYLKHKWGNLSHTLGLSRPTLSPSSPLLSIHLMTSPTPSTRDKAIERAATPPYFIEERRRTRLTSVRVHYIKRRRPNNKRRACLHK